MKKISLYLLYSIAMMFASIILLQLWSFGLNYNDYHEKKTIKTIVIILFLFIVIKTTVLLTIYWKQAKKNTIIGLYRTISIIDIIFIGAILLIIILYDLLGLFYGHNVVVILLSTLITLFCAIFLSASNILLYFACKNSIISNLPKASFFVDKSKKNKALATTISFMLNLFFSILLQLFTVSFLLSHKHTMYLTGIIFIGIINAIVLIGLVGFDLLSTKQLLLLMVADLIFTVPYSVFIITLANEFEVILILYVVCSIIGSSLGYVICSIKKRKSISPKKTPLMDNIEDGSTH